MCDFRNDKELSEIFRLFYYSTPVSCNIIDTGRGEEDFRNVLILELENGEKSVLKLSDNDFTSPEKIDMWRRTVEEYRKLGYYAPRIIPNKIGVFPIVEYKGRKCTAYAEEYTSFRTAEDRADPQQSCMLDLAIDAAVWKMTAEIAAKYFSYTDHPSGYCLFERFCPSDNMYEVLEEAINWHDLALTLPDKFQPQVAIIWQLWNDNTNALEKIYPSLPTSVFQADLNYTNVLVDDSGKFVGICDFNLCGRDVFLNYLFRESYGYPLPEILEIIRRRLRTASSVYHFSDIEKQAALMIFRCVKPLWADRTYYLKSAINDNEALQKLLDETEYFLTEDIDLISYMT